MIRGLGHRPDLPDFAANALVRRPASDLVGVGEPTRRERDWRHLSPVIFDQSYTNTCVPHAASDSLYCFAQGAAARGEADPIPFPSKTHAYFYGQLEDQRLDQIPRERRKILDIGMRAQSLLEAWSLYGVISEERWPFNPAEIKELVALPDMREVSRRIPFDVDTAGADAKLTGWNRVPEDAKSATFRRALDRCVFPIIAIDIYENFFDYRGGVYSGVRGRFIGRHMIMGIAYRDGAICFKNSHGRDFGEQGYIWLDDYFLDSPYARDGSLLTAAPAVVR